MISSRFNLLENPKLEITEEYILGTNVAALRTEGMVRDAELPINNPFVKAAYKNLGKPGSNEAYKLLHTKFSKKSFRRE